MPEDSESSVEQAGPYRNARAFGVVTRPLSCIALSLHTKDRT
ncbi:hypothetical protein [Gemmatimonas sp.]|jgi:hypothetical protein